MGSVVGDTNSHTSSPSNRDALKFVSLLQSCGMQQHVHEPTHVCRHTFDIVITQENSSIVSDINVEDPGIIDSTWTVFRDHFEVIIKA